MLDCRLDKVDKLFVSGPDLQLPGVGQFLKLLGHLVSIVDRYTILLYQLDTAHGKRLPTPDQPMRFGVPQHYSVVLVVLKDLAQLNLSGASI